MPGDGIDRHEIRIFQPSTFPYFSNMVGITIRFRKVAVKSPPNITMDIGD